MIALLLLALSVGFLSGCGSQDLAVIVVGSTSVQPYAEMLSEEYALLYPEIVVDVQGGGSSAGITAVMAGTADIGMSSRALHGNELELWNVVIAKDGLAVIVHPDNPLENLTMEQVRAIYAATVSDWGELGGREAEIHVIAREEGSGTRDAFENLVMADAEITPRAIVQSSNGSVRQLVSSDRHAIGFISMGLADPTVKAVQLDGVAATWANVLHNTYTLYRPFLFVTNGEPTGPAKHFIDYTLSAEGQQVLMHEGLIPMMAPATEGAEP